MGLVAVPSSTFTAVSSYLPFHFQTYPLQTQFAIPPSTPFPPQVSTIIVPTGINISELDTGFANDMSIDKWVDDARQSLYRQSPEYEHVIDTLKSVFEGVQDPERGASTIASIYDPLLKQGFQNSPVSELWGVICEAAKILGSDQEIDGRLINLLNSLAQLPDVHDNNGNPINAGPYGNYRVYWKDLPSLAIIFREYAIDIEPGTSEMPDDGDWSDAQRATLLNVITFSALYLERGQKDINMAFHAEVSLMEGIEVPYQTAGQQRGAPTVVPPAATWILLAGNKIYDLCKNSKDDKGRGFSLGRWALWKTKFGEIATNKGLGESVRDIASQAALEMGRIQG